LLTLPSGKATIEKISSFGPSMTETSSSGLTSLLLLAGRPLTVIFSSSQSLAAADLLLTMQTFFRKRSIRKEPLSLAEAQRHSR